MKVFSAYLFLIAWMSYLLTGMGIVELHEKLTEDRQSCHNRQLYIASSECHPDNTASKNQCDASHGEQEEKGCCSDSSCPRTCCHIFFAVSGTSQEFTCFSDILAPYLPARCKNNLPDPFLSRLYPPPNLFIA